jgi:cytochrome b
MEAPPAPQRIRLWDWPIRLMHWSLALLMPALWWTWKYDRLQLHELLGYITLGLLAFRLYWGFAGSSTARFSSFVRGPRAIWAYVRGTRPEPVVGHNPLGGLSVVALLGLMIAQVILGMFTQDVDGIESGPLTYLVSYETADAARHWHGLLFNVLLGFIALHLCAVAFYLLVKRDNLVGPMVTGRKHMAAATSPRFVPWWRVLAGATVSAALAYWVSLGCPLPWATA